MKDAKLENREGRRNGKWERARMYIKKKKKMRGERKQKGKNCEKRTENWRRQSVAKKNMNKK